MGVRRRSSCSDAEEDASRRGCLKREPHGVRLRHKKMPLPVVLFCFMCALLASPSLQLTPGYSDPQHAPGSLVAILDMQGFRGFVEFHSNPAKEPFEEVLVRSNLIGPLRNDRLTWTIWEHPVDLAQKDPCAKEKLGKELVNLSAKYGYLRTGREALIRDTYRSLGAWDLFERTLLLQSIRYGFRACAPIRSSVPLATYEARFLSPVSGHFAIRQLPDIATGVRADLLWTDGAGRDAQLQWSLVRAGPGPEPTTDRTCSRLWELISSDLTSVLFRSTSDAPVRVGGGPRPRGRTFAVATNFTSLEAMDIADVWVVLQRSVGEFVACAPLWIVHPREAVAEFRQPGYVQGYVHFYQPSAYGDATVVTVNLTLPKRNAAGFGIDQLTLPSKQGFRQQCTSLSLTYFNPMQIEPGSSPVPRAGTTDRYPVGDLGAKLGTLTDRDSLQATFYNQYLTLHGANGIIGRSVAVYEDSWYPLACSTLHTGAEELVATANFQGAITGRTTFRQHLQEPLGVHTSVHVDLRHKAQENLTSNHNWRIHSVAPGGQGCRDPGPVYNPYGVVTSGGYACGCSPDTAARCAAGDLSGRMGTIELAESQESAEAQGKDVTNGHFFVDTGLWLRGDFSVAGKLLVIYGAEFDEEALACAVIETQES